MQDIINRLRAKKDDEGFTLIELLVVVVIIGVLVAIAVPVYLNYREGAADKSAQSDVRGAISAVEQYYTENGNAYPAAGTDGTADKPLAFAAATNGTAQQATVSSGNTLGYALSTDKSFYVLCGMNKDGEKVYTYVSKTGGSVKESGAKDVATCLSTGTSTTTPTS